MQGQTQASHLDSMVCYTPSEMRIISTKLISGNECDTLLKLEKSINKQKDTTIASLERSIIKEENRYKSTERLAKQYEIERDAAIEDLNTEKTKKKWILFGWAGTSVLMTALLILALL